MAIGKKFWGNTLSIVTDIAILIAAINLALYLNQTFVNTAKDFCITVAILILAFGYKIYDKNN